MEDYTNYLKDAYKWFNETKQLETKTRRQLQAILMIEERHKLSILEEYEEFAFDTQLSTDTKITKLKKQK